MSQNMFYTTNTNFACAFNLYCNESQGSIRMFEYSNTRILEYSNNLRYSNNTIRIRILFLYSNIRIFEYSTTALTGAVEYVSVPWVPITEDSECTTEFRSWLNRGRRLGHHCGKYGKVTAYRFQRRYNYNESARVACSN